MGPREYEMSLLALTSWRAALSDNGDELTAIACVIRNHVLRYGKTYSQVCEKFIVNRDWPDIRHPALIDPHNGLISKMEGIYKNETPDYTSNHLHKDGCLYFLRVMDHQGKGTWEEENILKNPFEHPLVGQWGVQNFYV